MNRMHLKAGGALLLAMMLGQARATEASHATASQRMPDSYAQTAKLIDLGEYWETLSKAPIPLGGIVIKRGMEEELKQRVDRVLRRSVEYAFANPKSSLTFVKAHAQEMSEEVMYKHIDLYVNRYSVDLGAEGKRAVQLLFDKAEELGVIKRIEEEIFLQIAN